MEKKKKITLEGLAEKVDDLADGLKDLSGVVKGGFQLVRSEMASKDDLNEVKEDVKYIKNMLDKETGFIKTMEAEHPILVKRVVKIENKLGLPHHITE